MFYLIEMLFSFLMKSHRVALCVRHGAGTSSELRLRRRAQPGHPSSASAPRCCCARASSPVHTWGPWLPAPRECSWHLVDRSTAFSVMLWCASSSVWVTRVRGCPAAPPRPLEALLAPWWTGHFQVENMRIWYLWNKIWVTQTFSYFVFK